ncbi:hypothetical protein SDC9_76579 [bioreactor metagenome]|uniref:Uncharacterized protein n=1 Tax=bioreactor metagenome TaxID=1076179 RepID=A0A644YP31_9ZZZZ
MKNLFIFFILALFISACSHFDINPVEKEYSWGQDIKGNWYLNAASYNRCILIDTSISGKQIIISSHSDDLNSDGFLIVSEIENDTPVVVRRLDVFSRKAKLKVINHRYFLLLQDLKHLEEDYYKFYNTIIEYNEDWEFVRQAHIYLPPRMRTIEDMQVSNGKAVFWVTGEYGGSYGGSYILSFETEKERKDSISFDDTAIKNIQIIGKEIHFIANKRFIDSNCDSFDSVFVCKLDKSFCFSGLYDSVIKVAQHKSRTGEVLVLYPREGAVSEIEYLNAEGEKVWTDTIPFYSRILKVLPLDNGKFLYYIEYEKKPIDHGVLTSIEMVNNLKQFSKVLEIDWPYFELEQAEHFISGDILNWKLCENSEVILLYEQPVEGVGYPLFFKTLFL